LADDGTYFDPPEVVSHPEKEKESAGNWPFSFCFLSFSSGKNADEASTSTYLFLKVLYNESFPNFDWSDCETVMTFTPPLSK
jgi:hypothetical protein